MQQGDYGEARSEPWTYSKSTLPIKTYSLLAMNHSGKNKSLRARYKRKKHFFKIEDAQRILVKVLPPEDEDGEEWARRVINILRDATLMMLDRILFFLPQTSIESLYEFCIGLLDRFFRQQSYESRNVFQAKQLILFIADKVGISVTFPKA